MEFKLWGNDRPHPGQLGIWNQIPKILEGEIRTAVLACGRRWGKDRLSIWLCLALGLELLAKRQQTDLVPPVQMWVISPTNVIADTLWNEYKAFTKGLPRKLWETHPRRLEIANGFSITFRSAEKPDSLVGAGLDIIHISEGADLKDAAWEENLGPTLISPGRLGFACVNGTPGLHPHEWYRRLYARGMDGDPAIALVSQPSWDNPYLSDEQLQEIEQLKNQWSDRKWLSTFKGDFLPDGGGILRHVRRASTGDAEGFRDGEYYVGFFDLAPEYDFNAVSVFRRANEDERERGLELVQVYLDRWQRSDWDITLARLPRYRGDLYYDAGAGQWTGRYGKPAARELQNVAGSSLRTTPIRFDAGNKESMTENMASMLEHGRITLLDPEQCGADVSPYGHDMRPAAEAQIRELEEWDVHSTPAGNKQYKGTGAHDDMAVATMMAAWQATDRMIDSAPAQRAMEVLFS